MAVTDQVYTPDDYNQHSVLKVPGYLPLLLLYLLRYPVLYIIPNIPMVKSAEFLKGFAEQQFDIILLLSIVPVLLLGFALFKRTPQGSEPFRKIWAKGRKLLLFSVSINLLGVLLYTALGWKKFDELLLMFTYLDVVLLAFIWRSKRLCDVFSEFPEYKEEEEDD